jgi:methyl acetate hydrolase
LKRKSGLQQFAWRPPPYPLRFNTAQTPEGRSPRSLGWAGLANTFFWIKSTKKITGVFLTQVLPFFDHKAIKLFIDFERAVYQSV